MSEAPLTGGCQCGATRYAISAPPLRLYACHCRGGARVSLDTDA